MPSGKIAMKHEKGYGFITPDSEGPDIFFHVTGLKDRRRFEELQPGDRVRYEIDNSRDRPRAVEVEPY